MLIGHYAPALVLQRVRPSIPLWVLFVATQAVDIAWGLFVLTGVEHVRVVPGFTESNSLDLYDMPYSHGLVATIAWSVGLALVWRALRHTQAQRGEALILGLAVASHFVLDLVVHVPDLPLVGTHGWRPARRHPARVVGDGSRGVLLRSVTDDAGGDGRHRTRDRRGLCFCGVVGERFPIAGEPDSTGCDRHVFGAVNVSTTSYMPGSNVAIVSASRK